MPRSNSRIPLVRTTCWASNAIIGTFASSQNPKPLNDLSSSVTVAAKSLAGHRGVRPFLEGHTFTWLTFDEAGNTLPEEGLSRVLLDEQSFGRDLEEPAMPSSAPLQAVRTLRPKMLGVQALRMLQRSAGIACLGVTVGFLLSVPLVGPATPSSAPLQAVRTLRPKMLGVQALRMLQRSAGIACLGVTVGFPLSVPLVGPATPSSAPLQAVRTLSP